MDLSTLDPTKPPTTEAARSGAGRITDLAGATVTSFGSEHTLSGPHKFPNGSAAARPAAGNTGRIFINTTDNRMEFDTGSNWQQLHATGVYFSTPATIQVPEDGGVETVIAAVTIDSLASRVVLVGQCKLFPHVTLTGASISFRFYNETGLLFPSGIDQSFLLNGPTEFPICLMGLDAVSPGGTRTVSFRAICSSGMTASLLNATLFAFTL